MSWDPTQYLAFGGHRIRPALDLIARVPLEAPATIVDLGCGTGNTTEALMARWPDAAVTGVDNSPEMLARAKEAHPKADWQQADFADWAPAAPVELLYSNAALHWLTGHGELFPRLAGCVAPGGVLAVQMPRNWEAPSHALLYEVARDGQWSEILVPMIREHPTMPPDYYYDLLTPHVAELDIWEVEYLQALDGDNPVAEFVKGSWLKPFLDALEDPIRGEFEGEYRARIQAAYPPQPDGKTLFPFRRLFILAGV